MIIDKLSNISNYHQIPIEVISFINTLSTNSENKRYNLSEDNFVNIEEYLTKSVLDGKFETHDKYIDIQLLLSGKERIYFKSREGLNELVSYNIEKDITFYADEVKDADFVTLDGSNFVLIYPHEAHAPQISVGNNSGNVKKVVVKLKI